MSTRMSSGRSFRSASMTPCLTGLFKSCKSLRVLAGLVARFDLNFRDCAEEVLESVLDEWRTGW